MNIYWIYFNWKCAPFGDDFIRLTFHGSIEANLINGMPMKAFNKYQNNERKKTVFIWKSKYRFSHNISKCLEKILLEYKKKTGITINESAHTNGLYAKLNKNQKTK